MKTLEKNITHVFGQKGLKWLKNLPVIVGTLSKQWSLTAVNFVSNMSWNFVATAIQNKKIPVVLKISCDEQLLLSEYHALKHFDGKGAVQILDINQEYNALLLERAMPGEHLKIHSESLEETIAIYTHVVKQLASKPLPINYNYKHVSDWLKAFDKITTAHFEQRFIDKALQLRTMLLSTAHHEYLCHGDLHLENIINSDSNWLAIDPKGIVGEMALEAAAFDLISAEEVHRESDIASLILYRVKLLATSLDLDLNRLLSWIFVRIILSAQWFIEDKGDPSFMISLANYVYPLIKELL